MISDVYSSASSISSITPIDLAYLKEILSKDETKLRKLWEVLAYRIIILQFEKLLQFKHLTNEKIKMFCKLSTIAIYQPGDVIDVQEGGVLLRGGMTLLNQNISNVQKTMTEVYDTSNRETTDGGGSKKVHAQK